MSSAQSQFERDIVSGKFDEATDEEFRCAVLKLKRKEVWNRWKRIYRPIPQVA